MVDERTERWRTGELNIDGHGRVWRGKRGPTENLVTSEELVARVHEAEQRAERYLNRAGVWAGKAGLAEAKVQRLTKELAEAEQRARMKQAEAEGQWQRAEDTELENETLRAKAERVAQMSCTPYHYSPHETCVHGFRIGHCPIAELRVALRDGNH